MSTPAGLQRFSRSMVTRYKGTCTFCAKPTQAGTDFAALSGEKWLAVCAACATSITAQVRAMVLRLQAASADVDQAALAPVIALMPANLAAAMVDGAPEAVAYDALVKLAGMLVMLDTLIPAPAGDPRLDALRAVASNPNASPGDREFASSLATGLARYGSLTERQAPHADRLIKRYANGAAAAPAPSADAGLYLFDNGQVRKVYMTRNDRMACKVLRVHSHGDHHSGTFEYEQGGRRIVADALAAGIAHLMSQDEAAAFGRQYSFCCNCARYLDDDRSLAAGYGPVCASNMGWHYPSYDEASTILGRPCAKPVKPVDEGGPLPGELNGTWICDRGGEHPTTERSCDCQDDD